MTKEKMPAGRNVGYFFMVLGTLMIAAAMALVFYNNQENVDAGKAAADVLSEVKSAMDSGSMPSDAVEEELVHGMPAAEINGYQYVGYLSIPVLELELPVMAEWDYTRLKTAPCWYYGSTTTDNLVICAHNYNRHFGRLKNLQTGDLVSFTQMDGTVIAYEVVIVETLEPTEVSAMLESGYDLTLYTCTYGGQSRVTVRCNRVGSP